MASKPVPAQAKNPFLGLRPIRDPNALFGRDLDFTIIRERIYSGRTTLLFAASGAGKTSLLAAKVLPGLGNEFTICLHSEWAKEEPRKAVMDAIVAVTGGDYDPQAPMSALLAGFRRQPRPTSISGELPLRPSRQKEKEFLLILDQFEEVFQYWAARPQFNIFLTELCAIINAEDLKVRVMFSMRDDFLGNLSAFDNRIPDLFNNYCRLKYPAKPQAMEIIMRTAGTVDPGGLRRLVEDLSTFRRTIGRSVTVLPPLSRENLIAFISMDRLIRPVKRAVHFFFPLGKETAPKTETLSRDFVIPPYLQIVCAELWEKRGPKTVFLADYAIAPGAGNAAVRVLADYCVKQLNQLGSTRKQDLAARAFDFLMTREGAKMAYQLRRLAEHMDVAWMELEPVLNSLSEESTRILRRFKGTDEAWWYELYHDMYAPILYEWKRDHQIRRNGRRRLLSTIIVTALVLLSLWLVPVYDAYSKVTTSVGDFPINSYTYLKSRLTLGGMLPFLGGAADEAWAGYWDRRAAQAELAEDRDAAVLLRAKALETKDTELRRSDSHRVAGAEYAANLEMTLRPPGRATFAVMSADEKDIFLAGEGFAQVGHLETGGSVTLGRGLEGTWVVPSSNATGAAQRDTPVSAAFAGSDTLLTLTADKELRIWDLNSTSGPKTYAVCHGIGGFVIDRAGQNVFVASEHAIRKWPLQDLQNSCNAPSSEGKTSNSARGGGSKRGVQPLLSSIVLSPDEKSLLASTYSGSVTENRATDGSLVGVLVRGAEATAVSADGSHVAWVRAGVKNGAKLEILDRSRSPAKTISIPLDDSFDASLEFSPDGGTLVFWTQLRYRILDTRTGQWLRDERDESGSPGPHMSNTLAAYAPLGKVVTLFDPKQRVFVRPLLRTAADLLQFSPSGKYLIAGSREVRIIRAETGGPFPEKYLEPAGTLAISANGKCRASLEDSGRIVMRSLGSIEELFSIDTDEAPARLAVSRDCSLVAAAWKGGKIRMWDRQKRQIGADIQDSGLPFLQFSPDNRRLLISGKTTTIWSTADGSKIGDLGRILSPEFTPDSRLLYSRGNHTNLYWTDNGAESGLRMPAFKASVAYDTETGAIAVGTRGGVELANLRRLTAFRNIFSGGAVESVAIRPGGGVIAALSGGTLTMLPAPGKASTITGSRDFSLVAFSARNRQWMLTASRSGAVQLRYAENGVAIGAPAVVQPGNANEISTPAILSARFLPGASNVLVVTSGWLHLLKATDQGLRTLGSRQLSSVLVSGRDVYPLDGTGMRVAALVFVDDSHSHLDVVDFGQNSLPPERLGFLRSREWQRMLGLSLEQGDIVPLGTR